MLIAGLFQRHELGMSALSHVYLHISDPYVKCRVLENAVQCLDLLKLNYQCCQRMY